MKLRRTLSGILFGVGCAMTFVGLLALILPAIPNEQLQLVLASFMVASPHPLVDIVNTCMSFAIRNGWQVLLCGAVLLTIGVIFFSRYTVEEAPPPRREIYRRPVPQQEPLWEQPDTAPKGPNPFADMAMWEQFAPKAQAEPAKEVPKVGFGSPMLEPNRIEEEPTPPVIDPAQIYARPAPQAEPEETVENVEEIPHADPVSEPEEVPSQPEEMPENAPQSGTPVQLSPRIRSTMGKRREW